MSAATAFAAMRPSKERPHAALGASAMLPGSARRIPDPMSEKVYMIDSVEVKNQASEVGAGC